MPPYHRLDTSLPQSLDSGHQLRLSLIEFDQSANRSSNGWSGVELRIFLEPLRIPAIRMLPQETDMTNYVAARGLLETMDETIRKIGEVPVTEARSVADPRKQELDRAMAELREALTKYTDNHPTVVTLRERIKLLQKQIQ